MSITNNTLDILQHALGSVTSEELDDLLYAAAINSLICVGSLAAFCFLRPRSVLGWLYAPRLDPEKLDRTLAPPPIPTGYIQWAWHCVWMDEETIFLSAGLDAVMFLRFIRLCMILFGICAIFGLGILIPFNMKGSSNNEDLDVFTITNIDDGSSYFWGPFCFAYLFTFLAMYLMYHTYADYVKLRHRFLYNERIMKRRMTVMIHALPPHMRTERSLARYFRRLFPSTFRCAYVVLDVSRLEKMINKRDLALRMLERAYVKRATEATRPSFHSCWCDVHCCMCDICCCQRVDAIKHWTLELEKRNTMIENLAYDRDKFDCVPIGFVTFGSAMSATLAANVPINANPFEYESCNAPRPNDIYWPAMYLSPNEKTLRYVLVLITVFWLVVFWIIPISFATSLTSLESLSEEFPFLSNFLSSNKFIRSFIEGYLPTLILVAFMNILPTILRFIIEREGIEAYTWMEFSLLTKYFVFQVVNFFFVVILSRSFFEIVDEIIHNPSKFASMLGEAVPTAATLFINYIMLRAFAGLPLLLFRFGPIIVQTLAKMNSYTPAEKLSAEKPYNIDYGEELPPMMLIFLVAFCYSTIAPLILPFAFSYFAIALLVWKYQVMYVYISPVETGGLMWPRVYRMMYSCMIISQICLLGFFGLRNVPYQAFLLIPLPFLTFFLMYHFDNSFYEKSLNTPVTEALHTDHKLAFGDLSTERGSDGLVLDGGLEIGETSSSIEIGALRYEEKDAASEEQQQQQNTSLDSDVNNNNVAGVKTSPYTHPCLQATRKTISPFIRNLIRESGLEDEEGVLIGDEYEYEESMALGSAEDSDVDYDGGLRPRSSNNNVDDDNTTNSNPDTDKLISGPDSL